MDLRRHFGAEHRELSRMIHELTSEEQTSPVARLSLRLIRLWRTVRHESSFVFNRSKRFEPLELFERFEPIHKKACSSTRTLHGLSQPMNNPG
jgi:hypothetical protein